MKKQLKKIINIENIFCIIYCIYTVLMINESVIAILTNVRSDIITELTSYCIMFFVLKIIIDVIRGYQITWYMAISVVVSICVYWFSDNMILMYLVILMIAVRGIKKEKIIKITLVIDIIYFFLTIYGTLKNILPDWVYFREGDIRHSLGFSYPTVTMGFFLSIVMMYIFLRKSKIQIYEIGILAILNIILYEYTAGRTSFYLINLILIVSLLSKNTILVDKFKNNIVFKKILKILCYALPTIFLISILLVTILYANNNKFIYKVDDILSNRIKLTLKAFEENNITLFGEQIVWKGWGGYGYLNSINTKNFNYNYVDNSFARLLFDYGIIGTILIIALYTAVLVKANKQKEYWLIFQIFIILILANMEICLVNINRNVFLLTFMLILEGKDLNKKLLNKKIKEKNIEEV